MNDAFQPHSHDLRKGRYSQPGQVYILTSVTHRCRPVFASLGGIDLPRLMASLKGYTARHIKERIDLGSGPLWQDGYHDHALRREEDVRAVTQYIVANPLRARLVERLGDYPLWDAVWL